MNCCGFKYIVHFLIANRLFFFSSTRPFRYISASALKALGMVTKQVVPTFCMCRFEEDIFCSLITLWYLLSLIILNSHLHI